MKNQDLQHTESSNEAATDLSFFKSIFENSSDGILVVGKDGITRLANAASEDMLGYDADELSLRPIEDILPKKNQILNKGIEKKGSRISRSQVSELMARKKNGAQLPLEIKLSTAELLGEPVTILFLKVTSSQIGDTSHQEKSIPAITELNRKYSTLIGNLQGIVYRCKNNRDWTMEYISEGCLPITGYSPDAFLVGEVHFSDLIFKEDREQLWSDTQKALEDNQPFNLTYRIRDKKGNVKYLSELGIGIHDKNGNLEALEGFITDISSQKEAEYQLKKNEAKYKALLEAIPDMMFIQDLNGVYLDCFAPEPEKLFMPVEKFIGKNMKEILPPNVFEAVRNAHKRVIKEKCIQLAEYSVDEKYGGGYYEARFVPLNERQLLTIVRDVTQNKEITLQLKQEREKLRQYLQTAAAIFVVINRDQRIELINQKGCEVLGYTQEEIVGKNWFSRFIGREIREELSHMFDLVMKGEMVGPEFYENPVLTKDQKKRIIRWRNSLLKNKEGKITGVISSGLDVTEQILAEKQLRASEARNSSILQALPDLIIVHDTEGNYLDVQSSNTALLPMPRELIIGKNLSEYVTDTDQADKILKTHLRVASSGEMEVFEVTLPTAHGTTDFEARVVPLKEGKVLAVLRDITKTKAIKESLMIRNRALEAAGNGIIIVDAQQPDLPITYCNTAFTEITGYPAEEVIGLNCQFLQSDDRDQKAISTMSRAIKKGESCRVLLRNYKKDGTLFWNDLSITPLYDETAKLTHFIGVQNDVTELQLNRQKLQKYAKELEEEVEERTFDLKSTVQKLVEANFKLKDQVEVIKTAEQRAMESQAMFSAIVKNFPKGVITVFNADYEIVYIDGGEISRVGFNKSQFEGKRLDELKVISEKRMARVKEDINRTLAGEHLSYEIRFQNKSYAVNTSPLKVGNEKVKWTLFVYNDISKQIEAEKNMRMALVQERELNELKSGFISIASHEFRTPLSAISTSAILIGKHNEAGKEEKRMKYVKLIQQNVRNLVVLLNDFLSLSKLEEGKVTPIREPLELFSFTKKVVAEIEPTRRRGQQIEVSADSEEIKIETDPKLMHHILTNLLSNAIKYSEEGQKIQVVLKKGEESIKLEVADEGIGIPIEDQDRLFQRFFRAKNSSNIQGTGLGLNIIKQYAELLGGSVNFKSEIGKGTTFWVEYPIKKKRDNRNSKKEK